jgi:multidrug efflux pump subunit AcrA (membrane-fusion protein)
MNAYDEEKREPAKLLMLLLCLLIVGAGAGVAFLLIKMKKPPRKRPPKSEGTLVEVVPVSSVKRPVVIEAMGTVIPARELDLKAEVGGRIVEQSKQLLPGSVFITGGQLVCQIDRRDYKTALETRKAQVAQAHTALKIEEGRGIIARREWEMLKQELSGSKAQEELALRKPQLAQAKAAVKAAESARDKAQLDLDRTSISVPFPAVVREEFVEVGQLVSPQTVIARLAGAEKFWVRCAVPTDRLPYIALPGANGQKGASATILQRRPGAKPAMRDGRVVRLLPDLDPAGRMARVLIEVDNPLGVMPMPKTKTTETTEKSEELPPLLLGAYVRVEISGPDFSAVFALPRCALREGKRIWVMGAEGKLSIRKAEIAWLTRHEVLLSGGLKAGERVVTSSISGAYPGMRLRLPGEKPAKKSTAKPRAGKGGRK